MEQLSPIDHQLPNAADARYQVFEYWMTKVDAGEMSLETAFEVIGNEFTELEEMYGQLSRET